MVELLAHLRANGFKTYIVSGGTIDTYNTFSGKRADDPVTYASVGFRIGN